MEAPQYRNQNWRNLQEIRSDDPDYFAYQDGVLVQKRVSFQNRESAVVSWEPLPSEGTIFCQSPSQKFMEVVEDYGDPRSAMSDPAVHRTFGGHPDERVSNKRR